MLKPDAQHLKPIWDFLTTFETKLRDATSRGGQDPTQTNYSEGVAGSNFHVEEIESDDESSTPSNAPNTEANGPQALLSKIKSIADRSLRLTEDRIRLRAQLSEMELQRDIEIQQTKNDKSYHEQQILGLTNSLSNTMNELSQISSKQEGDSMLMKQEVVNLQKTLEEQKEFYIKKIESIEADAKEKLNESEKKLIVSDQEAQDQERDFNARLLAKEEEISRITHVSDRNFTASKEIEAKLQRQDEHIDSLHKELQDMKSLLSSNENNMLADQRSLDALNQKVENSEKDIATLQKKLAETESSYEAISQECQELEGILEDRDAQLQQRENSIDEMKFQLADAHSRQEENERTQGALQSRIENLEVELKRLNIELEGATASLVATKASSQQEIDEVKKRAAAAVQAEIGKPKAAMDPGLLIELEALSRKNEELSATNARLQSNLDDAEKLKVAEQQAGFNALNDRCESLQKELNDMLFDYETLMKASVDFEAERSRLESQIDSLQDRIETLESHLADEKIKSLGAGPMKTPLAPSNGATTPNALSGDTMSVLRAEFKKMMRDMRSEHSKALRTEQDGRRKLENELRQMRKDYHQLQKQNL
ncbi:hypothetical protein ABW19_dt0202097 [Dactylella cylindrospora]|nr:hypothetical protein ABW19_dt0202097 [Dactylella cylindrospora]